MTYLNKPHCYVTYVFTSTLKFILLARKQILFFSFVNIWFNKKLLIILEHVFFFYYYFSSQWIIILFESLLDDSWYSAYINLNVSICDTTAQIVDNKVFIIAKILPKLWTNMNKNYQINRFLYLKNSRCKLFCVFFPY